MAVYRQGYRSYEGGFLHRPAWLPIFAECYRTAAASKGFKRIRLVFILFFVGWLISLYLTLNLTELASRTGDVQDFDFGTHTTELLWGFLKFWYVVAAVLGALTAMLVGAGLIADDLRTRALPLYLARPIASADYMLGKALTVPALLAWGLLFPGLVVYLLCGVWQPDGESMTWLGANTDVPWIVLQTYVAGAAGFSGLMLFFSCWSSQRGVVMGIGATVLFGGFAFAKIAADAMRGTAQELLKHVSVILNAYAGVSLRNAELNDRFRLEAIREDLPDPSIAMAVNVAVYVLALGAIWYRARTAELSE